MNLFPQTLQIREKALWVLAYEYIVSEKKNASRNHVAIGNPGIVQQRESSKPLHLLCHIEFFRGVLMFYRESESGGEEIPTVAATFFYRLLHTVKGSLAIELSF